jgi:hypothetical protein
VLQCSYLIFLLSFLSGCAPMLTRAEYIWGAYPAKGDYLYVIRHESELQEDVVPIMERSAPRLVSERFEVVAVNLTGDTSPEVVSLDKTIPASAPAPADYDFVLIDDEGNAELWGRTALSDRLRAAGKISCQGTLQYDEQDSRVVYYVCDDHSVAYRFAFPYRDGCEISLDTKQQPNQTEVDDYRFWSVAGQDAAYVTLGWGFLYRVELCSDRPAEALDRFTAPEHKNWGVPGNLPSWPDVSALPYRLIGMADGMRLYQSSSVQEHAVVLVSEADQPRTYVMPPEIAGIEGRYLPQSERVIWNVMDAERHVHVLHSLQLSTGRFSKAELPF